MILQVGLCRIGVKFLSDQFCTAHVFFVIATVPYYQINSTISIDIYKILSGFYLYLNLWILFLKTRQIRDQPH